jgi:hypothetical protein
MTPQEKAKELIDSMYNTPHCGIEHFPSKHYCDCSEMNLFQAKQCALVALRDTIWGYLDQMPIEVQEYWNQVKQEIEKL